MVHESTSVSAKVDYESFSSVSHQCHHGCKELTVGCGSELIDLDVSHFVVDEVGGID